MEKTRKNRIWELDFVRGVCILIMIFDHTMFDLVYTFQYTWQDKLATTPWLYKLIVFAYEWLVGTVRNPYVHDIAVSMFFLHSGVCSSLSRSSIFRAIKLVAVAVLITACTYCLDLILGVEDCYIISAGVIHSFAVCMLLNIVLQKLTCDAKLGKVSVYSIVSAVLAVLTYVIYKASANFPVSDSYFAFLMGFPSVGRFSADYTTVFPWITAFLVGTALSPYLYKNKQSYLPKLQSQAWHKPVDFLGRYSIWVYVAHQPIITVLLAIVGLVCFGELRLF